ncbi:MAG TPA: TOBE domain-containing protein [Hyphomicrobiaceae bacterium]|nr:TOBE domain-containing protein [Hyphomicrobiaceae bacterium]
MKRTSLDLSQALGQAATDKRIDILRRIGEAGSISQAARGAGVSYKAAWQAIETLGNLAGQDLVEKVVGGSGGGGARLTDAGRRLLRAADELTKTRATVLARINRETDDLGASGLAGLGLRTSIRNQIPCTVRRLTPCGRVVAIELALADGAALRSRITVESAELLGLQPGMTVLALCKATAVKIVKGGRARPGVNHLRGVVRRATRTEGDKELSLRLDSGVQLVGFARAATGFRVGQTAVACVEESAVAIAVGA